MPYIEIDKKRILLVHIPRTGGTSIERWLSELGTLRLFSNGAPRALRCTPQHLRMTDVRDLLGENYFDHAYAVVRNPYERIESEFRLQFELKEQKFWSNEKRFSFWLDQNLTRQKREPFCLDNHIRPQWEFIGTGVTVFRFEDGLKEVVDTIAKDIGVKPPQYLPHAHNTQSKGDKLEWDLSDRLKVQDHYRRDFEVFNYDM